MDRFASEKIPFIDEEAAKMERPPPPEVTVSPETPEPVEDFSLSCENVDKIEESSVSEVSSFLPTPASVAKHGSVEILIKDMKNDRRTSSFKFPIHQAAEKGHAKELERLLGLKGDPLQTDFKNRTPLHYACGFPYQAKAVKMVNIILNCSLPSDKMMDLINYQDKRGETGLHIAARTGHRILVEKLIFAAADVNLKDKTGMEPLQLIYAKVPAAMKPVFDYAIECKIGDPSDQNLILRFDFGSIVGYNTLDPDYNPDIYEMETKLLAYALHQSEQKRSGILTHPVVQTFLFLKWKKIRILLWISILYHVIWLLLYTLFIIDLYLIQCPFKIVHPPEKIEEDLDELLDNFTTTDDPGGSLIFVEGDGNHGSNETDLYNGSSGINCHIGRHLISSLNIEVSSLFYVTASVMIKEMYEIYSAPQLKFYFYQLENVGQWSLIGVVFLTSIPIFFTDDDDIIEIKSWQYQAAALGIFLAWTLILSQVGKIPRFAIYIEILGKVVKSFTMFMITFASLLVAFMVSFQILMPQKDEFANFPWGFIKVLVMMAGEINYDEVFFEEENDENIPFPLSTRVLYAAFVAVVTIILFNLLIGLTVSDIQGLSSIAQLSNLSSQLEQIYLVEKFILSKKLQRWLLYFKKNHYLRYFLVTQQTNDPDTSSGYDIHISKVPRDLQHLVREISRPNIIQGNDEAMVDEEPHDQKEPVMNEENLRRIIKDVLKEVLADIKVIGPRNEDRPCRRSSF